MIRLDGVEVLCGAAVVCLFVQLETGQKVPANLPLLALNALSSSC
jgi:hypothetical protein